MNTLGPILARKQTMLRMRWMGTLVLLGISGAAQVGCRPHADTAAVEPSPSGETSAITVIESPEVAQAGHAEPGPVRVAKTPDEAPFVLTPKAAAKVRELLAAERGHDKLRVSMVEKFGGDLRWTISLTDNSDPFDDETFVSHGITLVVDRGTRKRGAGTTIDYVNDGARQGFTFHNPALQTAR
jgi:iron-sulfur cluster assembly accessory protein